jgi:recombination protein RecT
MTQVEKLKQAIATRPAVKTVWDFFESRKAEIAKVLPRHVTVDRLIGVMSFMIKSNADIANASVNSLIAAVIQTCQLGLEPGSLGHVYYVPFNNRKPDGTVVKEIQFILGYKGIVELLNNAGKAVLLSTECVYSNDNFRYALGLNSILEHQPCYSDRGEFVGVYAIAKNLVANEKVFVYLSKEEVMKVMKSSKASGSKYSPWNTWFEEMAKKTAVRRLCKLLPLSVQEQRKIATDETTKTAIAVDMTQVPDETVYEVPSAVEVEATITPAANTTASEPICPKCQEVECECAVMAEPISDAMRKRLFAICNEKKIPEAALKAYLKETFGIDSRTQITKGMYAEINLWLESGAK